MSRPFAHPTRRTRLHSLRLERLEPRETPAVFVVTTPADAGPGSLREAIGLANDETANPGGDTIQFAPALFGQTVALSTAADTSLGASALVIASDVTLDGFTGYPGRGPGVTIARQAGVPDLRLFLVTPTGRLAVDGLTLAGGLARGGNGTEGGPGGSDSIRHLFLISVYGQSYPGGGGAGLGGAVFNEGVLTISRSLLADNQAIGGQGGGPTTTTTLADGRSGGIGGGNAGGFGGGGNGGIGSRLFFLFGTVVLIPPGPGEPGGFGGGGGGGVPGGAGGFGGGAGSNSTSDGGGDGAGLGGAVFNHGGTVSVVNSTFTNNAAYGGGLGPAAGAGLGGGLFNLNGAVSIASSTFAWNTGGAVYVLAHDASGGVGNANPASLALANSILAHSAGGEDLVVTQLPGSGGVTRIDHTPNLITGTYRDRPRLLPLADNGGPTRTIALRGDSPARDTGDTSFAPPGTDQRGYPRVLGRWVDLGAFEAPPVRPLAVTPHTPAGGESELRLYDADTGQIFSTFAPFPGFRGAVLAAVADLNGDGIGDVVVGAGAGGGPHVKGFDGLSGRELFSFFAFDPAFTGGVSVAAADIDADGYTDIVVGAGAGGGPHVKAFSDRTGAEFRSFFAFDETFRGGVDVAAADLTGDGVADVVAAAGPGGGPHVKVFDGRTGAEVRSFFAYDPGFPSRVRVAAGDVTGDGVADIVTGVGPRSGPHVKVFDGVSGDEVASFFAYYIAFPGGASVAVRDADGDGVADIVTGSGPSIPSRVRAFSGRGDPLALDLAPFDPSFLGGVEVG